VLADRNKEPRWPPGCCPASKANFVNEAFARRAGLRDEQMGLGHAFEIDKALEDSFLLEIAQAQLVRQVFERHPIKWMPATKHKSGDIFWSHRVDGLFDLIGVATGQSIELLGMMTEAIHNPFLADRFVAIKGADYVFSACRHLGEEIEWRPDGRVARRAACVLARCCARLAARACSAPSRAAPSPTSSAPKRVAGA
jgi:beta-lysine 5,6-aminomutase alpha subunit